MTPLHEDDDELPDCYGDEGEYNPEGDKHCRLCDIKDACGAEVRAARKRRIRDRALGRSSSTAASSPTLLNRRERIGPSERTRSDELRRPDTPTIRTDASFWTALAHNTMLETLSAILKEFWFSVTQIPRIQYRSPWDVRNDKKE